MIKTNFIPTVVAMLIAATMFTSCQPSTPKTDAADAKVQEAKEELSQAQKDANAAQAAANAEEWKAFKEASEMKIKENEAKIAELKTKMKAAGKKIDAAYEKSIDELEQKNKDMKVKIDGYSNDAKSDWASFKREFNHDMDGLGQALKDLGNNNKK